LNIKGILLVKSQPTFHKTTTNQLSIGYMALTG